MDSDSALVILRNLNDLFNIIILYKVEIKNFDINNELMIAY